ncbi:hypothetical protein PIB30_092025, partial [Stylosanthes scabra]|nr:hypothetical protein [Stylosanthes scabra]
MVRPTKGVCTKFSPISGSTYRYCSKITGNRVHIEYACDVVVNIHKLPLSRIHRMWYAICHLTNNFVVPKTKLFVKVFLQRFE